MQTNIGRTDRTTRIVIGVVLLSLAFVLPASLKWLSFVAIIPLVTAFVRWCPLYTLFGLNTCSMSRSK